MGKEEIVNAKITDTFLGIEQGFLTFNIFCEFTDSLGKGVCSFGGSSLGMYDDNSFESYHHAPELLYRVLDCVGVASWENLKGKLVRIRTNGLTGCASGILAIGNILDDKWLNLYDFYLSRKDDDNER